MTRTIFWLALLLNLVLFAYLLWGDRLMQDNGSLQPSLNPDQIKVLGFAPPAPPSAVLPVSAPTPVAPPLQPSTVLASAPAPPAAAPAAPPPAAGRAGGGVGGGDLSRANERLSGLKLGPKLTSREIEHPIGYWVYIPPQKKHAELDAKIAQLKKLGVKEFFVVQEKGKWHDAISLNIFKTEDTAKKFLDRLKSKGVKSAVMSERQTRLKFTVFSVNNPDAATLSKLAEWQKDFTGIEMRSLACN